MGRVAWPFNQDFFSVAIRFYRTDCMHGDVTRQPSPEDREGGVCVEGRGGGSSPLVRSLN